MLILHILDGRGRAQRIEVLTLDDEWIDVTDDCPGNTIPPELVRYCREFKSVS